MSEPRYEVVSPEPRYVEPPPDFTVGIADLNGRRIGLLWDGLFRGDELMAIIADGLRERFPEVHVVDHTVFGITHSRDEADLRRALPALLRDERCEVVLSGLGA